MVLRQSPALYHKAFRIALRVPGVRGTRTSPGPVLAFHLPYNTVFPKHRQTLTSEPRGFQSCLSQSVQCSVQSNADRGSRRPGSGLPSCPASHGAAVRTHTQKCPRGRRDSCSRRLGCNSLTLTASGAPLRRPGQEAVRW